MSVCPCASRLLLLSPYRMWSITACVGLIPARGGENLAFSDECDLAEGSSPRVRGKRDPGPLSVESPGLIPACAGKTYRGYLALVQSWAHPRVCGENVRSSLPLRRLHGSSPRVRGKQTKPERSVGVVGLIPACAGKTVDPVGCLVQKGAHPRVCGENHLPPRQNRRRPGSSPRVRGKHRRGFQVR